MSQHTPMKRYYDSPAGPSPSRLSNDFDSFNIQKRFCAGPNCNYVFQFGLTTQKSKCPSCNFPRPSESICNGTVAPCDRCNVLLECTYAKCYLCGEKNSEYDPDKPRRLEEAKKKKHDLMAKEIEAWKEKYEALKTKVDASQEQGQNDKLDNNINNQDEEMKQANSNEKLDDDGEEKSDEQDEDEENSELLQAYDEIMSSQADSSENDLNKN